MINITCHIEIGIVFAHICGTKSHRCTTNLCRVQLVQIILLQYVISKSPMNLSLAISFTIFTFYSV